MGTPGGTKALKLSGTAVASAYRTFTGTSAGTISFRAGLDSNTPDNQVNIVIDSKMYVQFDADGQIKYYNGTSYVNYGVAYSANTSYRIYIDFNDATQDNKWRLKIDDGAYTDYVGTNGAYTQVTNIAFNMDAQNPALNFWIDDIGLTESANNWTKTLTESIAITDAIKKSPAKKMTDNPTLADSMSKGSEGNMAESLAISDEDVAILKAVGITNDDGRNTAPVTGADTWNNTDVSVGQKNAAYDNKAIGLRFSNLNIPQGAIILSAVVSLICKTTALAGGKSANIYGGAYDNFNGFSDSALPEDVGTAPNDTIDLTSESILWTFSDMTENQGYNTPDIKTIIQEIVDRAGWASGNAMAIAIRPNTEFEQWSKDFYDYGTDASKAAVLTVIYASPDSKFVKGIGKHESEQMSLADSMAKANGKNVIDVNALNDFLAKASAKGMTDGVSALDSAVVFATSKSLTQQITISDALAAVSEFSKSLADNPSVSDAIGSLVGKVLADNPELADSINKTIGSSLVDTVGLSDQLSSVIQKSITDIIILSDLIGKAVQYNRTAMDQVNLSDLVELHQNELTQSLSEQILIAETTIFSTAKNLTDTAQVQDAINTAAQYRLAITDPVSVVETLVKDYNISLMEAITVVDSISRTIKKSLNKKTVFPGNGKDKIILSNGKDKIILISNL